MSGLPIGQIVCGDCLEVMRDWPDGGVGSIITDPPFSSGSRTDAGKSMRGSMVRSAKWDAAWFSHDNMATFGFLFLMRLLFVELARVARNPASLHAFIDWRMYPNLYGAIESSGWVTKNLIIWDKKHFGMGSNYRNQHELVVYAEHGDVEFVRHDIGNVITSPRADCEQHPTEKPLDLITVFIECTTKGGDLILDPFCGSGTTCVAAKMLGRRYIGIDISPEYCEIARERLRVVDTGVPAKEAKAGQLALFNERT